MADYELQRWFAAIDTDRTGTINSSELQRALALGGLNFSLMACAQMIRLHDRDGSGSISLQEFSTLHHQLTELTAEFNSAAAGTGSLSRDQLHRLVTQKGHLLEPPAFNALCASFDPDRNGRYGLPEYTMLQLFLLSAKNIFRAFDPSGSGRATFDFSQFVYAAANTR